jgi:suppressor for copper-sensitivity B
MVGLMRTHHTLIALLGVALALVAGIGPAAAGEAATQQRPHVGLSLVAAALEQAGTRTAWAAVELRLDRGWKIYWRSPGEAGIPTTIDWSRSENVRSAETRWPLPKRARIWNVDTVGYGGEVMFPAALELANPAKPTVLRVRVAYGVCREICIPDEAVLTLKVEAGGWAAPEQAARIRAALARVPDPGNDAALRLRRVALKDGQLQVEAESADPMTAPDLLVEGPPAARFGPVVASLGQDRRLLRFDLPATGLVPGSSALIFTFIDAGRGFERRATVPFP